jgi:hypothetical protein
VGLTADGIVTAELGRKLVAHPRFARLQLDPQVIEALVREGGPKHYAQFASEVFDLHGQVKGKPLVGEKSPGYVRHLSTLYGLWPETKVVHLIRDGRDVALSVLDWSKRERTAGRFPTWAEDPVTTTALWWEWHVRLGREAGAPLGPERYYELRYELLVSDPELECRKLCEFLALAYDPAMVRFHEGRTRHEQGLSAKHAWLPPTPGLREWRSQMSMDQVQQFEAAAGDALEELGYERAVRAPDRAPPAPAQVLAASFPGVPLPEGWMA